MSPSDTKFRQDCSSQAHWREPKAIRRSGAIENRILVIPFVRQFRFVWMKGRCHDGRPQKAINANPYGSGK